MKLDNRGWGLSAFLGFVVVFLIFLFLASVNAYKLGLDKNEPGIQFKSDSLNKSKYQPLEERIVVAAGNYRKSYYKNLLDGDSVFVTLNALVRNNNLSSSEGCTGYVKISHTTGDNYQYTVYLKCSDYVSDGYNPELDG